MLRALPVALASDITDAHAPHPLRSVEEIEYRAVMVYGAALAGDRCEDASEIGETARSDALGGLRVDIGEDPKCDTVRLVAVRRQGHRSDEAPSRPEG